MIYWDKLPESEDMLTALIKRGLEYVNAPETSEISISFVEPEEIRALNKQYRGIDSETDVLSFALSDPDEWNAWQKSLPIALGDIVICTEVARSQADTYGHSLGRELGFLVVHGLLHLSGYDHEEPEDEEIMREAQRKILGDLK